MKKKYYYIDFLRIFSMFGVVFLHTVADLLRTEYETSLWHFSNLLTSVFSFAVPVFFMISGAMLLSNESSSLVEGLYKKRIKKILLPFLFWSFFAIGYYFITEYLYYGTINCSGIIYRFKHFLCEPVTIHLWFMYALIPIYIILPFIKILINNITKKQTIYMFFIWFMCSVLYTTAQNLAPDNYKVLFSVNNSFNLNIIGGYLGFFILGYYLHNYNFRIKKRILVAFIFIDILVIAGGTYIAYLLKNIYFEGFKVYCGIFTTSLSVAVFLLFKELCKDIESVKYSKLITKISETSFAVYLIHNLVIHFLNLNYFFQPENGVIYVLIRFVLVYIISFVISCVLILIKPLCFISTGIKYRGVANEKN